MISITNIHKLEIEERPTGKRFIIVDERTDKHIGYVEAHEPLRRHFYWRDWDPKRDEPEYGTVEVSIGKILPEPEHSAAISIAVQIAVSFVAALNSQNAFALKEQFRQRQIHQIAQATHNRMVEERRKEIEDKLKWYLGQKFKMRVAGRKSTVFGTIDNVTADRLYSTSEQYRGMTTNLNAIQELWVMYPGEKRYTNIIKSLSDL